jgi:hypothetical protein
MSPRIKSLLKQISSLMEFQTCVDICPYPNKFFANLDTLFPLFWVQVMVFGKIDEHSLMEINVNLVDTVMLSIAYW